MSDEGPRAGLHRRIVPRFVRRSFALKFTLVLLVMLASIGLIGVFATERVQGEMEESVRDRYRNVALQQADVITQWQERNRIATRLTSRNDAWTSEEGLQSELDSEYAVLREDLSADVANLHVVENGSAGWSVVASYSSPGGQNLDAINRGWLADQHFSGPGDVRSSSVYFARGRPVVGFASPVAGASDRYLLVEFDLSSIARSLQGTGREDGVFTQVVLARPDADENNRIMIDAAADDTGRLGGETLEPYPEGARKPIREAVALRSDGDRQAGVIAKMPANREVISSNRSYSVGYAPVEGTDWVVLVHAPYSSAFAVVQEIRRGGLLATGFGIVLICVVGGVLGYSTSSSIDRLRRKTEEMREGNLEVEIRSARIDSIGELYDAFAAMRDALQQQIEEAEQARKEAEVSRAEAVRMNDYLEEKAEEFGVILERAAGGDLTTRMSTDGENEAMDQIAREFNHTIGELEKTTGQLQTFADEVAESSGVVLDSAESVREASEQVADSVQTISDDVHDQRDRLEAVAADLETVVDRLESLQSEHEAVEFGGALDSFRAAAATLEAAIDESDAMLEETETVAGAAEEQAAELNEVSSRAEKLERFARPLGDILQRFETDADHEFVFSGGPSQSTRSDDEEA